MLENAVENFLDGLTCERDFDAPFLALLRSHGYNDVHFLHGAFEYGKDFIAKERLPNSLIQLSCQSKFGDIDKTVWDTDVQPQCEKMAYAKIGHPNFDPNLDAKSIVVFTGRFKGQAATLAEQYKQGRSSRMLPPIEFWDRDTLIEKLTADICLGKGTDWTMLGQFIQDTEQGIRSIHMIEEFSRRWVNLSDATQLWRAVLEACLIRDELQRRSMKLHGIRVIVGILRAACVLYQNNQISEQEFLEQVSLIKSEIGRFAARIVDEFELDSAANTLDELFALEEISDVVSTGPMLLMQAEIVALEVLSNPELSASQINSRRIFFEFVTSQKCCQTVISDNYAISILLIGLAFSRCGGNVEPWLTKMVVSIADSYDQKGIGLAGPWATPVQEISLLMASKLPGSQGLRVNSSATAAALLDVCSILRKTQLYDDAHNDFLATALLPLRLIPMSQPAEYLVNAGGCLSPLGNDYSLTWLGKDGWKNSASHDQAFQPRIFDTLGHCWVGASLSVLIRDRWWLYSLQQLAI